MREPHTFTGWVTTLAREHSASLLAIARGEGLAGEDALEAVQEAFETLLRLPQARALAKEQSEARALMGVIVRNAARNLRRRHHRARPHEPLPIELVDELPSADALIDRAEAHARLHGCVERLGRLQREVVTLRLLEEASGAEAASALGVQPGHVAVLLHRARRSLARCMTGEARAPL